MKIGILAIQGSIQDHKKVLDKLNIETVEVRLPADLIDINGLIIPGGESTTIGKLLKSTKLDQEIKRLYEKGLPIYGTCAGAIILAKEILGSQQPKLSILDISIGRNSYGRQIDSFETDLDIKEFEQPFHGIFIRAPVISKVHNGAKILAEYKDKPVLVRQKNILASTFHPELTNDTRIHEYFINMIKSCS
ncbi:MAG: pyridoxal 5'-phosphate synthase glutaminase subunit PdxT [Candidatus Woesearchaeota archaeon]|jgi:5'-phosphate synthase pdxT subunit|nr:pyridoxal 5'-phosphate synthase glutaminase subunit PdxT [Candidatus Woesearchaeota archaeon]MDP7180666.1 pyridoxal 5'-phosphate synthase glutaminase subunit PdxT [Candidatus Woesearchaeota archaeon]